jgi:hypothetical protein
MGNSKSNPCELQEYSDVCNMANCLSKEIKGIEAESASSTDAWIVNFKKGTTYNEEKIEHAFLKIWISNLTFKRLDQGMLKKEEYDYITTEYSSDLLSLDYEAKVYRDIIKPLIELNICPNFIKFLGLGENCSFDNLTSMLKSNHLLTRRKVNNTTELNRYWNLYGTSVALITDDIRNSIDKNYTDSTLKSFQKKLSIEDVEKKFTYNILANEAIGPGTITIEDFILKHKNNTGIPCTKKSDVEVWLVIFQVLAACYAMSSSKMCHNDLHLYNIYVEPIKEQRFNYIYDKTLFTFKTKHLVKVFDFDRSFVTRLGENPYLASDFCQTSSQCNRYIENLDALKIMSGIYNLGKQQKSIIDMCASSNTSQSILKKIFSESGFLTYKSKSLESGEFYQFNSTIEIMKNVSKQCGIENIYPNDYIPDSRFTFVCDKYMFNTQGKIIRTNVAELVGDNTVIERLNKEIERLKEENEQLKAHTVKRNRPKQTSTKKRATKQKKSSEVKKNKKIDCPKGQVRDIITKKCRQRKKPGPKKK